MVDREHRDSYLSEETIVGRLLDSSDQISGYLGEMRDRATDQRQQMRLDELIALQDQLTERIADYRRRAPQVVKNTYMQYVDVGSGQVDDMIQTYRDEPTDQDPSDRLLALDNELIRELQHVSINAGVEESQDAFDNLQAMVEDTCRKIAMDRSMSTDI